MKTQLKKELEEIIQAPSEELHMLKLKTKQENFARELRELKEAIINEKRFEFGQIQVNGFDYVSLPVKWRGPNYGKYFIH